jgi:hypothetical protein
MEPFSVVSPEGRWTGCATSTAYHLGRRERRNPSHRPKKLLGPRTSCCHRRGVIEPRDNAGGEAAMRFAARSEPVEDLRAEERLALDQFLAVLSAR